MAHYVGDYSFIHHDAANISPTLRKSRVRRHIQNQYNAWRRGGPTSIVQVEFATPEVARDLSPGDRRRQGLRPLLPRRRNTHHASNRARTSSPPSNLVEPRSILQRGNSDPFDSMAVAITPFVTRLLRFYREFILVERFPIEHRSTSPRAWTWTYDTYFRRGLSSVSVGHGLITTLSTIVARDYDGALWAKTHAYKCKTLRVIRDQLTLTSLPVVPEVHLTVLLLWASELEAGNLSAATVHARTAGQLLDGLIPHKLAQVDPVILEYTLAVEEYHSKLTVWPSFFTFSEWTLQSLTIELASEILDIPTFDTSPFSPWLARSSPDVSQTLSDLKEVVQVDHLLDTLYYPVNDSVFRNLQIRRLICQARLMQSFHAVEVLLENPSLIDGRDDYHLALKATTIMAALEWSRLFYRDYAYSKIAWLQLEVLGGAVQRFLDKNEPQDLDGDRNLWVWILYVGVLVERTNAATAMSAGNTATTGCFSQQFVAYAKGNGITLWNDLRPILKRFLYSDRMAMADERWWLDNNWHSKTHLAQASGR